MAKALFDRAETSSEQGLAMQLYSVLTTIGPRRAWSDIAGQELGDKGVIEGAPILRDVGAGYLVEIALLFGVASQHKVEVKELAARLQQLETVAVERW